MYAFTAGHSCNAQHVAFVKKLMKPRFTPCFSLNLSLYCVLNAMIWLISTSLKVVSIAVVFLASTNLRETVLRRLLIFSFFPSRLNIGWPGVLPGLLNASSTSLFLNFAPIPVGEIEEASNFLSAIIADATGEALILPFPEEAL